MDYRHSFITISSVLLVGTLFGLSSPPGTANSIDDGSAISAAASEFDMSVEKYLPPEDIEYPWGGRTLHPKYRLVATYGSPTHEALGVLGERPLKESLDYTQDLADKHQPHTEQTVLPTLEIIASVASAFPTDDGDYSQEIDIDDIRPWVEAAGERGMYVVLDLQPGRENFLTQAKKLKPLLMEPHVGLALDPEWRLEENEVHLEQIGSVSAGEVNKVARWLADLTKNNRLPQKVFMIHQFRLDMITDRSKLNTSHEELMTIIHMDGQGPQGSKEETYRIILENFPKNARAGWKNFYDEDDPLRGPKSTMTLTPRPWFVSYQ